MPREIQKFEVGIKAFIVKDNKLLVLKENKDNYQLPECYWEITGGRIDVGEESLPQSEVLLREIKEELGEDLKIEIGAPITTWVRKRKENEFVFLVGYICYYKSGEIKLSEEHTEYRFVNNEEWKSLNLAPGYHEAFEHFFNLFNKG